MQQGGGVGYDFSTLVSDGFMRAVRADAEWPLLFPPPGANGGTPAVFRSLLAGNVSSGLEPIYADQCLRSVRLADNTIASFEAFCALYEEAYALGLKGCTTFRPNPVTGSVLTSMETADAPAHCCNIEREAD